MENKDQYFFDCFYEELRKLGLDDKFSIDFEEIDSESASPWGCFSSHGESVEDLDKKEIEELACICACDSYQDLVEILNEEFGSELS